MPWQYIREILGPGLHWGKSQAEILEAIDRAHTDQRLDAADHLKIILKRRNLVMFEENLPAGAGRKATTTGDPD
jgi:hypothetical protein